MIGSRMCRSIPAMALWLPAIGCGASEPPAAGGTVRDSAGIAIIELAAATPTGHEIEVFDDPGFELPPGVEFGQVADISVGDGIVAVLDRLEAAVTTLDSTGSLIARYGQEGAGAGEFDPRGLASVVMSDGAVWVPDVASERLTRFAVDGTVLAGLQSGRIVPRNGHVAGTISGEGVRRTADLRSAAGRVGRANRQAPACGIGLTRAPSAPVVSGVG